MCTQAKKKTKKNETLDPVRSQEDTLSEQFFFPPLVQLRSWVQTSRVALKLGLGTRRSCDFNKKVRKPSG